MPAENGQIFIGTWNIRFHFIVSEFFGRRREWRISIAGCGYKMAVSVTGPTAKLGSAVMPGTKHNRLNLAGTYAVLTIIC